MSNKVLVGQVVHPNSANKLAVSAALFLEQKSDHLTTFSGLFD